MYIIETKDLCKKYGVQFVIDHVNMHIPEGSIYGFVGENGSGKTTIMRLLTGLASPTEGSFTICGVENTKPEIYEIRKGVSAIVEIVSLVQSMTAIDNMIYQEKYLGLKVSKEEREELLKLVHLDDVGNKKVGNFSLGMRQRLGIALALLKKPKIMFLDEPMNGLDPQGIVELRDLLIELNKQGITILISSHILSELEKIATTYGFISHGFLLEEISVEELQNKCKKTLALRPVDYKAALKEIKAMGFKHVKEMPNNIIEIKDDGIEPGNVIAELNKKKITFLSINTLEESIEDYYMNLIGKKEAE